jgi:hypothetical protein
VSFVWFWTFWHWSTEGFRSGALLRSPLQGIASHWDEWYRHESSESERSEIDTIGGSVFEQRRFVCWLARQWAKEARWRDEMLPARYVLAQLSRVAPFDKWTAFEKYRTTYAAPGIAAIVLDEESEGEPGDVRRVEAIALPLDEDAAAAAIVSDGFHTDGGELSTARRAAMSLLNGKGLLVFLGLWLLAGARPYPRYLRILLVAGWVAVAALIVRLLVGSDPGASLVILAAAVFALWSVLLTTAVGVAGTLTFNAWRAGRALRMRTERRQVHLRMNDGLSVHGGSAGLAFCMNSLLAAYRSHPLPANRSWLWERFFCRLRGASQRWAATGAVDAYGNVEHVVLEPKIRACLRSPSVTNVLTPWQTEAKQSAIERVATTTRAVGRAVPSSGMVLGFASTKRKLRSHRCRHAAQSLMAVGDFTSKSQLAANVFAVVVTVVMAFALPDIRNLLQPPDPPRVVVPGSPSPYHLWVSLDTDRPDGFEAVLESGFWSNRRAHVFAYGGKNGSVRAEMRLTRNGRPNTIDQENGTVWITRRRKFLGREYTAGERVASYPLSHVNALSHD